jgi:hypothetical protein
VIEVLSQLVSERRPSSWQDRAAKRSVETGNVKPLRYARPPRFEDQLRAEFSSSPWPESHDANVMERVIARTTRGLRRQG